MATDNRQNTIKIDKSDQQKHLQRSREPLLQSLIPSLQSFIPSAETLYSKKKAANGRKGLEMMQTRLK
jgi:hypothetical protein